MELFFKNMPQYSGMYGVVIQHLDPTHVGILPELLQYCYGSTTGH
jgi:two-component system CheB/CheR fusion protein